MIEESSPEIPGKDPFVQQGSNPANRLVLAFQADESGRGSCFHDLRWFVEQASGWTLHRSISNKAFQAGSSLRRWISELHSFDSDKGVAIIKVGQADAAGSEYKVNYFWMSLNLNDMELELLRRCSDPFEGYADTSRPGHP